MKQELEDLITAVEDIFGSQKYFGVETNVTDTGDIVVDVEGYNSLNMDVDAIAAAGFDRVTIGKTDSEKVYAELIYLPEDTEEGSG